MTIHGDPKLPELRVGMIQPSIGVRHDDHTMMIRADAASPRSPIIAPNYNELGAELHYHPVSWLKVDVGGFDSSSLRDVMPTTLTKRGLAYLGRLTWAPQFIDYRISGWLGVSQYATGDFAISNAFFGVGKDKVGALMIEASKATRAKGHETQNWMAMLSVPVVDWLTAEVRYEQAKTDDNGATSKAEQFVVGAQFFAMPYVELRPEYRLMKTDEYVLGQYTLQLHMFF